MMDDAEHADTTLEEAPVDDTTTDGTEAMADDPAASAVATEAVAEAAAEAEPEALAEELRAAIEAILMVAERPVEPRLLAQLIETSVDGVETACQQLAAAYEEAGRGFILARVAGGWRFQSHPDQAAYVERFVLEGQTTRLSDAEADADAEAVTDAEAEVDGEDTAAEVAVAEDPTAETDVAEAVLEEAAAVIDQADDGVVIDLRDGADQPIAPEQ